MNRHRNQYSQSDHDRAFLNTLLILIGICVLCMIFGKATGYGQSVPATDPPPTKAAIAKSEPNKSAPAAPTYSPTTEQAKDLRISQLEAINAQQAWNVASQKLPEYDAFNKSVTALAVLCQKIRADNKWPDSVKCDINQNPVVFGVGPSVQPTTAPNPTPNVPAPKK